MSILTFKLIAMVSIFITGLIGGLLSRWLSETKRSETLFSLGNAFAGGVFLGAGLIHMLPDAQEGFSRLDQGGQYPWFGLVCCAGFLSILFLEKVLVQRKLPHEDKSARKNANLSVYPYVLMIVLSIHSIITGIALGTESRFTQAGVILLAVLAHKSTAAFALGISLMRGKVSLGRLMRMITLFSFTTPFGVLLGIVLMQALTGQAEVAFEAGFDALAAGSFLYVALLDILQDEFSQERHRLTKFIFVLAGLGLMALVAIWT